MYLVTHALDIAVSTLTDKATSLFLVTVLVTSANPPQSLSLAVESMKIGFFEKGLSSSITLCLSESRSF
jgi:hypothetical protein